MNQKTNRMLELLIDEMSKCEKCSLKKTGGFAQPYWTQDYQGWLLIGEAPGNHEVDNQEPFIGKAGEILWTEMLRHGIKKEHCAIINSVNCRPVKKNGKGNGKPTVAQQDICREWIKKFTKILQPDRILLLGGYALEDILNTKGIRKNNANLVRSMLFDTGELYEMVPSVHPASLFYGNGETDRQLLEIAIEKFAKG